MSLLLLPLRLLVRLPVSWVLFIGRCTALLIAPLASRRRRIIEANLALCLPELAPPQRRRLATSNLRSTALSLFENLLAWHAASLSHVGGRSRLRLHGAEHLSAALARGRGVMLLCPHFTMIEMIPRALADPEADRGSALPCPAVQVARRHNDSAIEAYIEAGRQRWGPTLDKKDVRGMLRALRRNAVLIYAPDQNFSFGSVFAPFFGIPAATTNGTRRLAERAACAVLCCFVRRIPDGWQVRIDPPLQDFPGQDELSDATRINGLIEAEIRAVPEQYLWAHRRFRSRPEGADPLYDNALLKHQHRGRH